MILYFKLINYFLNIYIFVYNYLSNLFIYLILQSYIQNTNHKKIFLIAC